MWPGLLFHKDIFDCVEHLETGTDAVGPLGFSNRGQWKCKISPDVASSCGIDNL